jgi:hypothetical protein
MLSKKIFQEIVFSMKMIKECMEERNVVLQKYDMRFITTQHFLKEQY